MVREYKDPIRNAEIIDVKEEVKISAQFEFCDQQSSFRLLLTNERSTIFVDFPQNISFQFGSEEFGRLNLFVDLFRVQKVVQPIGLLNIIPIVECSKNRQPFPPAIVKTHIKVSLFLFFYLI